MEVRRWRHAQDMAKKLMHPDPYRSCGSSATFLFFRRRMWSYENVKPLERMQACDEHLNTLVRRCGVPLPVGKFEKQQRSDKKKLRETGLRD